MAGIDPKIRRVKEAHRAELLSRPGVTGVGIAYKKVGGKQTDILAILVTVRKKGDVPTNEQIPPTIEGYPTDVIQCNIRPAVRKVPIDERAVMPDAGFYNPLVGGICIGPCRVMGGIISNGTLGAIVIDKASRNPMLLSCCHVMCGDKSWKVGDQISQPGLSYLIQGTNVVGTLARAALGGMVDCAVAYVVQPWRVAGQVVDIGQILSVTNTASHGQTVRKRGYMTRLTYGTVFDPSAYDLYHDYGNGSGNGFGLVTFYDQILIQSDPANPAFTQDGDSGAVIVNDINEVVGLFWGHDTDTGYAVASPIDAVLAALDVSMYPFPKTKEIPEIPKNPMKEHHGRMEKLSDYGLLREKIFIESQILSTEAQIGQSTAAFETQIVGPLEERLARLEAAVGELRHFIRQADRPDLGANVSRLGTPTSEQADDTIQDTADSHEDEKK